MSDLERVGDSLDEVLRRLGIPARGDAIRLIDEWQRLAGEPWASRGTPVGVTDGELLVEVPDGATATLLQYQAGALVSRLADALGTPLVQRVRVRVAPPKKGL